LLTMPGARRACADDRAAALIVLRHPVQQSEKPDPGLDDQSSLCGRGHVAVHGSVPEADLKPVETRGLQEAEGLDLLGLVRVECLPNDGVDGGPAGVAEPLRDRLVSQALGPQLDGLGPPGRGQGVVCGAAR
jgi:hypothetical protein